MIGLVAHLSQAATGSLVTAVWQGILLAVVTGFGLRLLPKTPAAVRFAIWFAVFVVVTALPVVSLWPRAEGAGGHGGAWILLDERWCLAIAAVWVVASAVRATTLVVAGFRVRALWKRATPVELAPGRESPGLKPGDFSGALPRGEARCYSDRRVFRGQRGAQICTSDEVDRPTVIGFFSPKILIPAWLLEKLTPAELEQIVLHEAGHLGRADDWMNLLQKIALVLFPLNPALAWVERRLCFERELAVDERVLRAFAGRAGAAKAYAACLATLAEYRLGRRALALALGALGRESELGRRVGRILRRGESMRPLHAKLVLGGAMLGLLVGAAGLERCPQIVGFSAPATREQGTGNREQAAVLRGEFRAAPARAVAVTYKLHPSNVIQDSSNVIHATMAIAAVPRQDDLTPEKTSDPVRMVRAVAPVAGARNRSQTVSDAEPAAAQSYVMQWVTVTAWQGGDGTRVVMTTTRTVTPDMQGAPAGSAQVPAEDGARQMDRQFVPYAIVPVSGGWLAFQL